MAIRTPASYEEDVFGRQRVIMAKFINIADGDTWDVPGFKQVKHIIGIIHTTADAVAADKVSATYSGRRITFEEVGTDANNDVDITVAGI